MDEPEATAKGVDMQKEKIMKFKNLFNLMLEKYSLEGIQEEMNSSKGDEVDLLIFERDNTLAIKLRKRKELFIHRINEALQKIDEGEFGTCLECGEEIEVKRLIARPTANLCIKCKEQEEKEEVQVLYKNRSHTLGKEIINNNVLDLAKNDDEFLDDKILKFNRKRIDEQAIQYN